MLQVIHETLLYIIDYDNEHSRIIYSQQYNDTCFCLLNICFSLQEIELVCLVPLVLQVNMAYWAVVFVQDLGQDSTAMQHAA